MEAIENQLGASQARSRKEVWVCPQAGRTHLPLPGPVRGCLTKATCPVFAGLMEFAKLIQERSCALIYRVPVNIKYQGLSAGGVGVESSKSMLPKVV